MDIIGDKSIEKYDGLSTIFLFVILNNIFKNITDDGYGIKNLRLQYEGSIDSKTTGYRTLGEPILSAM